MSLNKPIWDTEENAKAYDEYASNFPMYKDTSKDLVLVAGIKPGMTIIDLAAGTGATTQAILDQTNGDAHIIAVDQAEAMLKKGKEKFTGQNIEFIAAEAEDLDKVIKAPVDAVICNSAFWQIKPQPAFNAVSKILKDGGIFAFNLPDQMFNYKDFINKPRNPSPYNLEDLINWAKEAGLSFVSESMKTYTKNVDEVIAFSQIPVMKTGFKTEEEQKKHLDGIRERYAENPTKQHQWVYLTFKK